MTDNFETIKVDAEKILTDVKAAQDAEKNPQDTAAPQPATVATPPAV